MTISRIDHGDGSTTYESPLHSIHVPRAKTDEDRAEEQRAARMAIVEAQARTVPADGNIGPSGRLRSTDRYEEFLYRLVDDGIRATLRNLAKLRERADTPELGAATADLVRVQENLRGT